MERINIPVSIQNTANVDKLQQREIADPAIHALQNREIDKEKQDKKMESATEVDQAEGEVIDPDKKRERGRDGQKKRKKGEISRENHGPDSGKFVDYSA